MEVHETAAALGIFANNSIKGSSGGTVLNAMLRDMKSKSKDGAIAIGDTAVAIYDASGNARGFSDIIADVEKATVGMTGAQKDAALMAIFGDEAMRGVNIALETGSDNLKELEKDFKNSEGAAARMGEVMNDNLGGDLKGLASAWEGFKIALFDAGMGDFARPIVQGITSIVQKFPSAISAAGEFFEFITRDPGETSMEQASQDVEKFGDKLPVLLQFRDAFQTIKEKMEEFKEKVMEVFGNLSDYFSEKIEEYQPTFDRMGEIFTQAKELVVDVLTELWGFAGPILDILGTALRILGDVAMIVFASVIVPAIDLLWTGMQNAWSIVQPILEMMKANLETTGQAMTWLWENAGQPLVTFLGGAFKAGIDGAKAVVEAFSGAFEWLGGKITAVTGFFTDMKDKLMNFKPPEWVSDIGGKISGAASAVGNFVAGSHATGLERVGYDGYVAELHKGESVLTAQQSQALRNAGMLSANSNGTPKLDLSKSAGAPKQTVAPSASTNNSTFNVTVNVPNSNASPSDIGVAVRRELERLVSTTQAAMGTP